MSSSPQQGPIVSNKAPKNPQTNLSRKGRGSKRCYSSLNENQTTAPLENAYDLFIPAASKSTLSNLRRARSLFPNFAKQHGLPDPVRVSAESSTLVLNFLARYCGIKGNEHDMLRNDTMGGMIQGLRMLYEENGHEQTWRVDEVAGDAGGNPLIGNAQLTKLRKAHRVLLAKHGSMSLRARPITVDHICNHAAKFWFGHGGSNGSKLDIRDTLLHSVLVIGLNMGMRYDEVAKIQVGHVSLDSSSFTLTMTEVIKNSTEQRNYFLREWPGNTDLRNSLFMDPTVALSSWLLTRGNSPGPLFCDVKCLKKCQILDTSKAWPSRKFSNFLQARLVSIGVGAADVNMYSGHSIKRGAVQLYRSLGLRDENIMEIIQMKGTHAYSNYCAAYNDCAPPDLPRFANISDLLLHAQTVLLENQWMSDENAVEDIIRELAQKED